MLNKEDMNRVVPYWFAEKATLKTNLYETCLVRTAWIIVISSVPDPGNFFFFF
jgi:hypothetical protein